MIIFIDLPQNLLSQQYADNLGRLAHEISDIYLKGRHRIVMHRRSSSWMRDNLDLGRDDKVVLGALYSEFTQYKELVDRAPCRIDILDFTSALTRKGGIYTIGSSEFIDNEYNEKPRLLVENKLSDGDFIGIALSEIAFRNRLGPLRYEISHGGGDDMPALLADAMENLGIVVCVSDSDKRYPGAKSSAKNTKIKRVVRSATARVNAFVELPCHEAENLIPLDCYEHFPLSPDERSSLAVLRQIEAAEVAAAVPPNDRFKIFFDLKTGWESAKYDAVKHAKIIDLIRSKLSLVGIDADNFVIAGFGNKLTRRLTKESQAVATFCKNIYSCQYWLDLFLPLMEKLVFFLVGCERRPAM